MIKTFLTTALVAAGIVFGASTNAEAAKLRVGTLSCNVESGWGLVIGSRKTADCVLTTSNGKKKHYTATITKIGADVGYTTGKNIAWVVFSLEGNNTNLSGTYLGVNVEATVGAGLGANALVGGLNNNFALQPLSVQGQAGINAAVTVQALSLR